MRQQRCVYRLVDEVGRPGIVSAGDRGYVVEPGRDDDRHIGRGKSAAQLPAQLETVHPRHDDVDEEQIRAALFIEPAAVDPVAGLDHFEVIVLQRCPHQ